uniref:Uncharacterized protein n=1 Tax=Sus scrofa TaxID=9823 RepID=A0A8D0LL39_PIG
MNSEGHKEEKHFCPLEAYDLLGKIDKISQTQNATIIINKSTNNKCWRGYGGKETLLYCWWECKLVQPLWKTVWRYLRKLNIEPPYNPAIQLLRIYPDKTFIQKDTCTHPMFIAALFTTAKTWKQPKCPSTDEWIKKMWHIYTKEYYSTIKGQNNATCSNMDVTRDSHNK